MNSISQLGSSLPAIGFGTVHLDETKAAELIEFAIKTGYRLIDTAPVYGSEKAVGQAIKKSIGGGTANGRICWLKPSFPTRIRAITARSRRLTGH